MIRNQNIICISSIDWDFLWQQHQEIMSTFAQNENRVLFIENTGVRTPSIGDIPRIKKRFLNWIRSIRGFREERQNLYIYSPLIFPFPYSKLARILNKHVLVSALKKWMKVIDFYDPIIWTFLPTYTTLDISREIGHKTLVYYCTDNFYATSKSARKILNIEREVIQEADVVFAMSQNMYDYCSKYNPNTVCVPMGVRIDEFSNVRESNIEKPPDLEFDNSPVIGFVGGIRQCIDQELVMYLAERFKQYHFIFVGPIQTDIKRLANYANIRLLGMKQHADIPRYIKFFDACIIPYVKDDYTNSISPAKLNEYLAMGKPVVSTDLREIEFFSQMNGDIIYVAKGEEEFAEKIEFALQNDSEGLRAQRIRVAESNSWHIKIETMSQTVESVMWTKRKTIEASWQEKLISIYRVGRRQLAKAVFSLLVLWIMVFHTPLIWYLSKPLELTDSPVKSDAIVVLAGGVGESGKAGQGYEERVQYAIELYAKGYAQKMIFSSGFMYTFKEPEVMKALAISLGVPADDIILEKKATNTYQNIIYTTQILNKKRWQNVNLISSPFHMLRCKLLYKKVAPQIKVQYTPIPYSRYYQWPKRLKWISMRKQITMEQIRGILHEYAGIVYYWWKGWL